MKPIPVLSAAVLLAVVGHSPVGAQSIPVTPGNWETTMTMTMPFSQEPTVRTSVQCIRQDSYDPTRDLEMQGDCEVVEQDITGNTLTWRMSCRMAEGAAVANGQATIDGDRGEGRMTTDMTMNGQTMSMTMEWQSKRIGDC